MSKATHSFSIEKTENPLTGEPFGPQYTGVFTVRRPSIGDNIDIGTEKARILSRKGNVSPESVGERIHLLSYIFAFVAVTAESDIPAWFNMDKLYDENDEAAVGQVFQEVNTFVSTFRGKQ